MFSQGAEYVLHLYSGTCACYRIIPVVRKRYTSWWPLVVSNLVDCTFLDQAKPTRIDIIITNPIHDHASHIIIINKVIFMTCKLINIQYSQTVLLPWQLVQWRWLKGWSLEQRGSLRGGAWRGGEKNNHYFVHWRMANQLMTTTLIISFPISAMSLTGALLSSIIYEFHSGI